jgi:hypothetical protein
MSDRDILKSTLSTSSECLAPEQLELLLDGKQSHPHLAECPRCQAELAMLKSFEFGSPLPDEGAAVAWIGSHLERHLEEIKQPSRGGLLRPATQRLEAPISWLARIVGVGGMRWVVPAAAVAAVAIASAILLRPAKEPQLQANITKQTAVYRSQEIQLVSPLGGVPQVPRELNWQTFNGAATYRIVVMEVDHSALWSSETKQSSIELPASLRAKMLPGKPILWQVTALDAQARVLGTSQVQKFIFSGEHSSKNPSLSR